MLKPSASHIGAAGVALVQQRLISQGFNVSLPVIDLGYDLISDWSGHLSRIQVKTSGAKSRIKSNQFTIRRGYTKQHWDILICCAVDQETPLFHILHMGDVASLPITLCLNKSSPWLNRWDILKTSCSPHVT